MNQFGSTQTNNTPTTGGSMSEEEQGNRRKQIREILKDTRLSQTEKSRTIQSLMDGRRRSSGGTRSVCSNEEGVPSAYVNSMAQAAAAAADYYSSDDEGDAIMSNTGSTGGGGGGGGGGRDEYQQLQQQQQRPDDISYGYDQYEDARSIASEITHSSHYSSAAAVGGSPPQIPVGSYRQMHGRSFSLQDWNDNDRAIAAANTGIFHDNPAQVSRLMEQSRPPCQHYERNCTIISPCCGLAFGCRICHDECPVLPPPLNMRKNHNAAFGLMGGAKCKATTERRRSMPADLMGGDDEENHHPIDRFAIREVICRECCTRQSSKTNNCINCGVSFGEYHCSICNLWMSGQENPYHCEDCGFCRVGGRENFRHCHDCGMCIDAILFDDHNCKSGKYMSNCPICQEDLFSSRHASHEMPCGHAIHWHCFKELTSYDTRCPVCKKTAETPEQMAATWSAISMGISLQPVPPEMARMVNIYCNDCEQRETNRRWHFLGVRCNSCMSFNTTVEQIVLHGKEAAQMLDQLEGTVPSSITADVMMEDAPSAQDTSQGSSLEDPNHMAPPR